jgi:hypothetical protein
MSHRIVYSFVFLFCIFILTGISQPNKYLISKFNGFENNKIQIESDYIFYHIQSDTLYTQIKVKSILIKDSISSFENDHDLFFHYIRIGFMSLEGESNFAFGTINGIRVGNSFNLGLGVELNKYQYFYLLPLFIDLRINSLFDTFSPILFADFGYSLTISKPPTNQNVDGFFLNIGSGIEFKLNKVLGLNLELGWKHQWSKKQIEYGYYNKFDDYEYNYFVIMLGFSV